MLFLQFLHYLSLIFIRLRLLFYAVIENTKVIFKYDLKSKFFFVHVVMKLLYMFNNPYKIHKRFKKFMKNKDMGIYGETSITTLDYLLKEANLKEEDVYLELGFGRGKTLFWVASFLKNKSIGIDLNPVFMDKANCLVKLFDSLNIELYLRDISNINDIKANVIYFYSTGFDEKEIEETTKSISKMQKGTRIITISNSLVDYADNIKVTKVLPASFEWGDAYAYIQEIV